MPVERYCQNPFAKAKSLQINKNSSPYQLNLTSHATFWEGQTTKTLLPNGSESVSFTVSAGKLIATRTAWVSAGTTVTADVSMRATIVLLLIVVVSTTTW